MRLRLDETHVMERLDTPVHRAVIEWQMAHDRRFIVPEPAWLRRQSNRTHHAFVGVRWQVNAPAACFYPSTATRIDPDARSRAGLFEAQVRYMHCFRMQWLAMFDRWMTRTTATVVDDFEPYEFVRVA